MFSQLYISLLHAPLTCRMEWHWVTLRSELILGLFPALDDRLKPPQPVLMLKWLGNTPAPSSCEEKGGRWGKGVNVWSQAGGSMVQHGAVCWKPLWNCSNKALQLPLERVFSTSTALCGWQAHSYRKGWQDWSQLCRRWFPESVCSSLPFFVLCIKLSIQEKN